MKKHAVMVLIAMASILMSGCSNKNVDVIVRESETEIENIEIDSESESEFIMSEVESSDIETITESSVEESLIESSLEESMTDMDTDVSELTEGEIAARIAQQLKFDEARQLLYDLPNSKDKTLKINQMDRQIVANNAFDFSTKNVVFIGDSITEGIAGAVTDGGHFVSYPDYVESLLHFNKYLNHGKGGRMFSDYGGEELSLAFNFGNVTNNESDIIIVFAGANDYLSAPENKEFGNIENKESTAGYCGMLRYFMKELDMYYGDRDIFFVMMYDIDTDVTPIYKDITTEPTLNDYLDVQRKLAKEYGFNVIDLYSIGFMDCTDPETESYFLNDNVHPNDNGNIVLGEHIAAELSLYYGQQ